MLASLLLLFVSSSARADTFAQKCTDFAACAQAVAKITGQKYVFSEDVLKGKPVFTDNLEMTKENAELIFTTMLNDYGYTRVPLNLPNVYQIQRQRDARDSAVPTFTADATHAPELPNHWDIVTLSYRATHGDAVEDMARMARSFSPANARVIPNESSGTLTLTDSAANLKKLYPLLKEWDRKPTAEMLKRRLERKEPHRGPPPAREVLKGKKGRFGDPAVNPGTIPPPEVRE